MSTICLHLIKLSAPSLQLRQSTELWLGALSWATAWKLFQGSKLDRCQANLTCFQAQRPLSFITTYPGSWKPLFHIFFLILCIKWQSKSSCYYSILDETGVFTVLAEFNIVSLLLLYRLALVDIEFLLSTWFEELLLKLVIAGGFVCSFLDLFLLSYSLSHICSRVRVCSS